MDSISAFPLNVYYTALTGMSTDTILYEKYSFELASTENRILGKLKKVEAAIIEAKQ